MLLAAVTNIVSRKCVAACGVEPPADAGMATLVIDSHLCIVACGVEPLADAWKMRGMDVGLLLGVHCSCRFRSSDVYTMWRERDRHEQESERERERARERKKETEYSKGM